MLVAQPHLPVPLVVQFPFPAWATRGSEALPITPFATGGADAEAAAADPFAGLPGTAGA
jgi:hypothetical protein